MQKHDAAPIKVKRNYRMKRSCSKPGQHLFYMVESLPSDLMQTSENIVENQKETLPTPEILQSVNTQIRPSNFKVQNSQQSSDQLF